MSARKKFLLVLFLFAAPVLAAALLFYVFPEWTPQGRLNYGELLEPPRPLPEFAFEDAQGGVVAPQLFLGRWTLLQLGAADCEALCQERLALTRQVRLALNQKRSRVQRVYLAPDSAALARAQRLLESPHPQLQLLAPGASSAVDWRKFFDNQDADAVLLIDPLGYWVMRFQTPVEPRGLHRDLKKLLRFSQVG